MKSFNFKKKLLNGVKFIGVVLVLLFMFDLITIFLYDISGSMKFLIDNIIVQYLSDIINLIVILLLINGLKFMGYLNIIKYGMRLLFIGSITHIILKLIQHIFNTYPNMDFKWIVIYLIVFYSLYLIDTIKFKNGFDSNTIRY